MSDVKDDKHFYDLQRPARALYLNAVKARGAKLRNGDETKPKYDVTVILDEADPDYSGIRDAIIAAAAEKWPGRKIGAEIKAGTFNIPISDGTIHADKEKAKGKDREAARGKKLFKAKSDFQPTLSIIEGGKVVDLINADLQAMHSSRFYPGVMVGFRVSLNAYDRIKDNDNDGVTARLYKVLSLNKGERLGGGGRTGAEVFKDYVGYATDEDPTAGADLGDANDF